VSELEPRRWRAWSIDFVGRRPGRLQLRRVVVHLAEAASFTWDLTELPPVRAAHTAAVCAEVFEQIASAFAQLDAPSCLSAQVPAPVKVRDVLLPLSRPFSITGICSRL